MDKEEQKIPVATLEMLARSFLKEASSYGFKQVDYVRFVNFMLDYAMSQKDEDEGQMKTDKQPYMIESSDSETLRLPLNGERVTIRAVNPLEDRSLLKKWLEDEFGRYFLLSRTTARKLKMGQLLEVDSNIVGVITLHDETPIGAVAYLDYNANQRKAELRKLIGESTMRGKGFAKEATALWIRYGYSKLGLKKIYLNTFNTNIRNIKLNEELGFRVEGILRNEVFIDGEYKDVLRMGLWRE